MGERSDHLPLKVNLPLKLAPQATAHASMAESKAIPGHRVLHRPLSPGQKQMLRSHLESIRVQEVRQLADEVAAVYEAAKELHSACMSKLDLKQAVPPQAHLHLYTELECSGITNDRVDEMAAAITELIHQMHQAAFEVLPAAPDRNCRKAFRPRQMSRDYQRLRRERSWLIRKVRSMGPRRTRNTWRAEGPIVDDQEGSDETQETCAEPDPRLAAQSRYREAGKEMRKMQACRTKKASLMHMRKMQKILHTNRKKGHKLIFERDAPTQKLEGVKDVKTKLVHTEGFQVRKAVQDYFTDLMQEPSCGEGQSAAFPWEARGKGQLDPFDLRAGRHGHATCQDEHNMLYQMDDPSIFLELLNHLAKNKAAGPDGIPNEILQALPSRLRETIRELFVVMWLTGHTPDSWKVSRTVLLYKKGDPMLMHNWRPIALANTLYKTWTSMVTHVLSTYGEKQGIIGCAQEGFRRYRNTSRQLQMAILMIEDAALYHQDLYSMYIDFSSAFNTVNHKQLLLIMERLGFPSAAVMAVKSIYTNACTKVSTPFGDTDNIKVKRGTIQGDTLSPYLFLIFIEPLLRWLQHGGRGYAPGCLAEAPLTRTVAALAYADDLQALTGNLSNLKLQAEKVERFSCWSGMEVNARKCAASAILHGHASAGLVKCPDDDKAIRSRLDGQIKIGEGIVPYLPPDQPYKYLGILLTLTLNWGYQYKASLAMVIEQSLKLQTSFATPSQKLQVFRSKIIAALRYVFSTTAFSPMDIKRLDAVMTRFTKRAVGLMGCTPNALIHEDVQKGGLGMTSLLHPYVHEQATTIVKSLHDNSRLGSITKYMVMKQIKMLGMLPGTQSWQEARYCSLARKLAFMQEAGVVLQGPLEIALEGNAIHNVLSRLKAIIRGINVNKINRIAVPLYELGIFDFSRLTNAAGTHMMDAEALARLPGLCSKVTARHKKALNRLTLLLNGQDWVGDAPAHAYSKIKALSLRERVVKRGLTLADIGEHPKTNQQRIVDFPCTVQPHEEPVRPPVPSNHVSEHAPERLPEASMNGLNNVNRLQVESMPSAPQMAAINKASIWAGRTRNTLKRQRDEVDMQAASDTEAAAMPKPNIARTQQSARGRRRRKTFLPLLSRESRDAVASKQISWGWQEPYCTENGNETGVCLGISKIRKLGPAAGYELIRSLYNEQDAIEQILAHRLVDGGAQRARARQSFAFERGCQVQYLVKWADTTVVEDHLQILAENGYTTTETRRMKGYGGGPARLMVEASWNPTWEPEARLLEHRAHADLIQRYREANLDGTPSKLMAHNIDEQQCPRLQQGLDAEEAPCNADHRGLKDNLHIDLDPIHPDLDIVPAGTPVIQCEEMSDCYAKDETEESNREARALVFDDNGQFIASINLDCLQELEKRHAGAGQPVASLEGDVLALLKRYKHGNESTNFKVNLATHWQISPQLSACIQTAFPVTYERFASPLDVHPGTVKYWTPFAEDSAFGAEQDGYSTAWDGCSQASPPFSEEEMDKAVRWAMASALTTAAPVLTIMPLSWRRNAAYTKWLGHPLVHVLLKCSPQDSLGALRTPADFWLEDETVYLARTRGMAGGMLVLVIANRQGAESYLSQANLDNSAE